ncbi:MAG: tetratricopeptide repeat protein [Saccharothrix sp.]|nr:tetratricopeptide repeat protein [Saccharothrix sp.]
MTEHNPHVRNIIRDSNIMGPVVQAGQIGQLIFEAAPFRPAAVVRRVSAGEIVGEPFSGRSGELRQALGVLRGGAAGLVVAGMGGVGKSALARQAAAAAVRRFPGGVFWTDLHGYRDDGQAAVPAAAVFGPMLRWLGVPGEEIPGDVGEQAAVYGRVLDALARRGRPVLLVLDNVSSGAQVRDLVDRSGPHRVVVTSRATLDLPSVDHLHLDVLGAAAALDLLDEVLRAKGGRSVRGRGAEDLVEACGGLPLALRIAAALLADDPGLDPGALARRLRQAPGVGGYARGEAALTPVFDTSWRWLVDHRPDWARLLRLLCLAPGPDLSTEAAAALAGQPPDHVRTGLDGLRRAHLVHATGADRWGLHDLVRAHTAGAGAVSGDDVAEAETRLLDHYARVAGEAASLLGDTSGSEGSDDALAWLDTERAALIAAVARADATGRASHATRLGAALGGYLNHRRYLADGLAVAQHAYFSSVRLSPRDQAVAADHLGVALREVRRFDEAVVAHERCAQLFREAGDWHGEGRAWNNLSAALVELRRFEAAVDASRRARERFRELNDPTGEGIACNNLGMALQGLRRFGDAVTAHERARDLHRDAGSGRGEGLACTNLGFALAELGRFDEAIATTRWAVELHRAEGGRFDEAQALNNLGTVYLLSGRFGDATGPLRRALDLYEEFGDRNRAGVAWNNLGNALHESGRVEEAVAAHQRAVELHRENGDRSNEGKALTNLGVALHAQGRAEDAVAVWELAVGLHRADGDRHHERMVLNNLGRVMGELGRAREEHAYWLAMRAAAPTVAERSAVLDAALDDIVGRNEHD